MKQMEIDSLINCCVDYFDGARYTVNHIGKYRSLWRNSIVRYMSERSISVYSQTSSPFRHDAREERHFPENKSQLLIEIMPSDD